MLLCETQEKELTRRKGEKRSGDNVTLLFTVFVGTLQLEKPVTVKSSPTGFQDMADTKLEF